MKKAIISAFLSLFIVFSFTVNVWAEEEVYCFDEINFVIPEYCSEIPYDYDGDTVGKWQTNDAMVEFSLQQDFNYDGLYIYEMSLQEIEYLYRNFLTPDGGEFEFESADYVYDYDADCALISGTISYNDVKSKCISYVFSTNEYIYVLSFSVFGDSEYNCVVDVVSSLYFEPYYTVYYDETDEYYYEDDTDETILAVIPIVFFSAITILFKFLSSKDKVKVKKKNTDTSYPTPQEQIEDDPDYEINGKRINKFNERIVTGSSSATGFAARELERERKERENMFKQG